MTVRPIIAGMAILAIISMTPSPPAAAAETAAELLLLYSNNVNGEIEPCG